VLSIDTNLWHDYRSFGSLNVYAGIYAYPRTKPPRHTHTHTLHQLSPPGLVEQGEIFQTHEKVANLAAAGALKPPFVTLKCECSTSPETSIWMFQVLNLASVVGPSGRRSLISCHH
jgi:hypothetical protein